MSDNPIQDAVTALGVVTKEQLEERLKLLKAEEQSILTLLAIKDGKVLARKPRRRNAETQESGG